MAAEYIRAVVERGSISYDTLCRALVGASLIEPDRYITEETTRAQATRGAHNPTNYAAWLVELYIDRSFIQNTRPGTFRFAFQLYEHRLGIYLSNRKERYLIRADNDTYRICYQTRNRDDSSNDFLDGSAYCILLAARDAPPSQYDFDIKRMHVPATAEEVIRVMTEL